MKMTWNEAMSCANAVSPDLDFFEKYIQNVAITELPNKFKDITRIGSYAFARCSTLTITSLPEGITSIGNMAFYDCTGLTSLTFKGTPSAIESSAFTGCTNLTTLNVPWAEGAVAGAPWGATNATINYNYKG